MDWRKNYLRYIDSSCNDEGGININSGETTTLIGDILEM